MESRINPTDNFSIPDEFSENKLLKVFDLKLNFVYDLNNKMHLI